MDPVTLAYILVTGVLAAAGLTLVVAATRAYLRTIQPALLGLAAGFTVVVAAAIATAISALLLSFQAPRLLLFTHNSLATTGYLLVIYSLRTAGGSPDGTPSSAERQTLAAGPSNELAAPPEEE